jgi:O-antigen ligase
VAATPVAATPVAATPVAATPVAATPVAATPAGETEMPKQPKVSSTIEYSSFIKRTQIINKALQLFLTLPFTGIGLMNAAVNIGSVTHNDYLVILVELGIIGECIFLGILFIIWRALIWRLKKDEELSIIPWPFLGSKVALVSLFISLLFINVYTVTLFWLFLGLALKASQIYLFEERQS